MSRTDAAATTPLAIPRRERDRDLGRVVLSDMFAVHTTRPARTQGRPNCCHAEVELGFLEAGRTHARVGDRSIDVLPGQFLVVPGGVEHSTRTGAQASRGMYLQVRPSVVEEAADGLGVPGFVTAAHEPAATPSELSGGLASLRAELGRARPSKLLVEHLGLYLTGAILRFEHERSFVPAAAGVPPCTVKRLERTLELMHTLPHERHSLEHLAVTAGLSRFRYAHLFRAHYGISPHAYLVRHRVRLGAARLRETEASIAEIAYDLGFASGSAFARHFRRQTGQTPATYRAGIRAHSKN